MYLFETYNENQDITEINHNDLKTDLVKAGFSVSEIEKACDWLDKLAENNEIIGDLHDNASSRLYNDIEMNRLDTSCRGFIYYLEQINILTKTQRELLIDRLLALDTSEINIEQIKWSVLMILVSQTGQEKAYSKMEDLIVESNEDFLH